MFAWTKKGHAQGESRGGHGGKSLSYKQIYMDTSVEGGCSLIAEVEVPHTFSFW